MTDALDRLDHALDVLLAPATAMAPPEASPPSGDRLRRLLDLRNRLGVQDSLPAPLRDAAEDFGNRCAGPFRRDDLADLARRLLACIDEGIVAALDAGVVDDRVVRSADFRDVRTIAFPDADRDAHGQPAPLLLVAGVVASLPPGHRLSQALPDAQLFDLDGNRLTPALLLGRTVPTLNGATGPPRRFYNVADAIRLTSTYRSRQLREIEARREQQRREELERHRRFEESELGRLYRAQRELDRLRLRGELPDDPPPAQPAVRGAGPR